MSVNVLTGVAETPTEVMDDEIDLPDTGFGSDQSGSARFGFLLLISLAWLAATLHLVRRTTGCVNRESNRQSPNNTSTRPTAV